MKFLVTIFDESDPVLVIITPPNVSLDPFYTFRDYRDEYPRHDFLHILSEFLPTVIEREYTAHHDNFIGASLLYDNENEMFRVYEVSYRSHAPASVIDAAITAGEQAACVPLDEIDVFACNLCEAKIVCARDEGLAHHDHYQASDGLVHICQ